jgi:FkbM family methyltransferase
MLRKLKKGVRLLRRRQLAVGMLRYGVAGAIEHLPILDFVRPRCLIDVGANKGQFALATISMFPNVKIYCFEPLPGACATLRAWSAPYSDQISIHQYALAGKRGSSKFYVTNRADSSSFFEPGKPQQAIGIDTTETIEVATERLDSVLDKAVLTGPSLLKLDVQGGELDVLIGSEGILPFVDYVYLELSFVPLYKGQPLFDDLYSFMIQHGFRLRGLTNGAIDPVQGPTQTDALFCRRESLDFRDAAV